MIEFRAALQQRLNDILVPAVGIGSDPADYVKTFDTRLRDVDVALLPFLVINVRTTEKLAPGEIGTSFQKHTWVAHIYYMDMELNAGNYDVAELRRDHILSRVEKALEKNKFLVLNNSGALQTVDTDGHQEKVYDSSVQAITWDESGQDGHQSFVSELYFEIYTDRW